MPFTSCLRRAVLPAACLLFNLASLRADDWPVSRHDARNTAYTAEGVQMPLRLQWRVPIHLKGKPFLLASGGVTCVSEHMQTPMKSPAILVDSTGRVIWSIPRAEALYLRGSCLVAAVEHPDESISIEANDWKTRT